MTLNKKQNMKKRVGLASLVSTLIAPQMAAAATALDGLRLGLQGGYVVTDSKVKVRKLDSSQATDTSDVAGRGIIGGVLIDWGRFLSDSKVLLGLEATANLSNSTGKKDVEGTLFGAANNNLKNKVQLKQAYDLSLKFGYNVENVALPYFKVGGSLARWKSTSQSEQWGRGSSSKHAFGFVGGLGVDFSVKERLSLGMEYSYHHYGSKTHVVRNNVNQDMVSVKVRPSANMMMLRLSYKLR